MNNLYFNNKDLWNDFNCGILKGIEYPTVNEKIEIISMEGNIYGDLVEKTGNYKDLIQIVKVRMFNVDDMKFKIALIKDWLTNIQDKRLFFKNNLYRCLYVKHADIIENYSNISKDVVDFTIKFQCEPFYFDTDIKKMIWNKNAILRSETMIAYEPIIEIEAVSDRTNITINEKELNFQSIPNETYIIDCEREYVYKKGTKIPIITSGEFFKINRGENTFNSTTNDEIEIKLKNRYRG